MSPTTTPHRPLLASPEDWPRVESLLKLAGLATDDIDEDELPLFLLLSGEKNALQGCVAVEYHDSVGLLRSLAVAPGLRQRGLGHQLLHAAEAQARADGIKRLYLLTTTAEPFFARCGYQHTARGEAPPPIAATPQFSGLCPSSASFMSRALETP